MTYTTLISSDELATHKQAPNWIIVDCRHDLANPEAGKQAYNTGHIPDASFVHVDHALSGKKYDANGNFKGRHPLPDQENFIDTLRNLGINNDSQVVAYDAQGGMFAARLWWMLRWIGHENVAVLDGGIGAWIAQGHSLSSREETHTIRGTINERPSLVDTISVGDVFNNLSTSELLIVDARAPDRFRGENETMDAKGGHIPHAKNRFFKDNLQANGHFKPAQELRTEWQAIIGNPANAVMQCGSGVTACHNLLALEVAKLPGAILYPGSWSEWSAVDTRPIATGDQ